ncbi:RNA polymerase sigma factor [Paraliomyxa miuraensis]|uniref:RNA polymerase sigma factor n=1 Tax=Paraliomyxa miuraensis TaxID=376150 RepID=UPI00225B1FB3|nr:sigma-70 family RNA polymerase sigma factor [Paraliomyxa miuraensis]MCX4246182.1 sigma-70 family RNA polymerase sigma factor [Paraliomyxa miuraensis]
MTGGLQAGVTVREPEPRASGTPRPAHAAPPRTLEEVYARHSDFVWRIVRRMGIPDHAVEDVMHEVFLVVHRRLDDYDGRASMTTWLYHLTRGVVSNHRRSRLREQRRLRLVDPRPSAAPDPEAHTSRGQAAAFVREFLEQLDSDKREVFELVELDGLPVPEVAELIGVNLNTAYSRLRAARQRFGQAVARMRAADGRSQRSQTA